MLTHPEPLLLLPGLGKGLQVPGLAQVRLIIQVAAAVNWALAWHCREQDLWLMALSDASLVSPPLMRRPPSFPPLAQRPHTEGDIQICWRWNQGRCTLAYCRFRHVCFVCQSPHSKRNCPLLTSAGKQASSTEGTARL